MRDARARGWCHKHYRRWRKHGDPLKLGRGACEWKHGATGTPEHNTWIGMKKRCYDKNQRKYSIYGGKGISVCEEWRNDFMAFLAHVGPRPSPKHSIDRIDSNKDYMPGNVRWATAQQQSSNRPNYCHFLSYDGRRQALSEWAREMKLSRLTLSCRLRRAWSIEKALTTPARILRKQPSAKTRL